MNVPDTVASSVILVAMISLWFDLHWFRTNDWPTGVPPWLYDRPQHAIYWLTGALIYFLIF